MPDRLTDVELAAIDQPAPPKTRYHLTVTVEGNTHAELIDELVTLTRGGLLIDSWYETRDEFHVIGGRSTRTLVHQEPGQTPERYVAELSAWSDARKAARGR